MNEQQCYTIKYVTALNNINNNNNNSIMDRCTENLIPLAPPLFACEISRVHRRVSFPLGELLLCAALPHRRRRSFALPVEGWDRCGRPPSRCHPAHRNKSHRETLANFTLLYRRRCRLVLHHSPAPHRTVTDKSTHTHTHKALVSYKRTYLYISYVILYTVPPSSSLYNT